MDRNLAGSEVAANDAGIVALGNIQASAETITGRDSINTYFTTYQLAQKTVSASQIRKLENLRRSINSDVNALVAVYSALDQISKIEDRLRRQVDAEKHTGALLIMTNDLNAALVRLANLGLGLIITMPSICSRLDTLSQDNDAILNLGKAQKASAIAKLEGAFSAVVDDLRRELDGLRPEIEMMGEGAREHVRSQIALLGAAIEELHPEDGAEGQQVDANDLASARPLSIAQPTRPMTGVRTPPYNPASPSRSIQR
jgi:hypothetical protein